MNQLPLSLLGPNLREPTLLLVGTDHRSAPLELRERVAYSDEQTADLLVHLLARPSIAEVCLLSTCNRTEVYVHPRDDEEAYRLSLEAVFLARAPEIQQQGRLYVKRNGEAARHLLAVASGLESMVLGEPEVLGQVRQAAVIAEAVGASGTILRRLLRTAITAGKRARAETQIASGAVSLGYAVAELARNIFTRLEDCRVLLLGAGQTAAMVARSLLERGAVHLRVANRNPARAERFRREFPEAEILPFEACLETLPTADLIVASTSAEEPVLTRGELAKALEKRPHRPMLVVDLGVPRNVEAAVGRLENVFLHHLDSLDHLIQRNLKRRREEIPRVQEIVDQELGRFRAWYRSLEAEPLVARLQKRAETIRREELAEALPRFPEEIHGELDRLTRSLVRKILHSPSVRLRSSREEDGLLSLDLVRELFQLDEDDD